MQDDNEKAEDPERISIKGQAPAAYRAMAAFDRSIELEPRPRAVKIRASQLNGCANCIDMDTRAGARGWRER